MDCLPPNKLLGKVNLKRSSIRMCCSEKRHLTPRWENLHLQSRDGWRVDKQKTEK